MNVSLKVLLSGSFAVMNKVTEANWLHKNMFLLKLKGAQERKSNKKERREGRRKGELQGRGRKVISRNQNIIQLSCSIWFHYILPQSPLFN